MSKYEKFIRLIWKLIRIPPQVAYRVGLGPLVGRFVLLLTTTGRKSGLARVTPLQYEEVDGLFYIGSARGDKSDWFRNIQANPEVEVRVKHTRFSGYAKTVTDPTEIADFLLLRLQRHPRILGMIFRAQGYPAPPSREQLEAYASDRAMVIIQEKEGLEKNSRPT